MTWNSGPRSASCVDAISPPSSSPPVAWNVSQLAFLTGVLRTAPIDCQPDDEPSYDDGYRDPIPVISWFLIQWFPPSSIRRLPTGLRGAPPLCSRLYVSPGLAHPRGPSENPPDRVPDGPPPPGPERSGGQHVHRYVCAVDDLAVA